MPRVVQPATCPACDDEFLPNRRSRARIASQVYCSLPCRDRYRVRLGPGNCRRCGQPRDSAERTYCRSCRSDIITRETCGRCGQPRGDSSHPGYCRPCKQELERESAEHRGQWKKPQAICSRCGEKRDGRHLSYCRACWQGPIREERFTQPCGRCGRMRDPADRVNPSYCYRCWYDNWLRRKYGVTVDEFEARLAAQGGVCAICGGRPADWKVRPGSGSAGWHADHDHESGIFRGVLCQHCNIGLGHFRDDLTLVRQAAAYLERHLTG